jgi:hypothetical protein
MYATVPSKSIQQKNLNVTGEKVQDLEPDPLR